MTIFKYTLNVFFIQFFYQSDLCKVMKMILQLHVSNDFRVMLCIHALNMFVLDQGVSVRGPTNGGSA